MTHADAPDRRRDVRTILIAQAIRAAAYGFGAVLLGASLDARGASGIEVGLVLSAIVTGTILASLVVARRGERIGRRRMYAVLFLVLAATGIVFGASTDPLVLALVGLLGAMSTDVIESGPFTSLEQPMLADASPVALARVFGRYNAVAAIAGALGALAAGAPGRVATSPTAADHRLFLVLVPVGLVGAALALRLSPAVEVARPSDGSVPRLDRSRSTVSKLAALFAVDSFAGGFTVQSFVAFWLAREFGASVTQLAVLFATAGLVQAGSFLLAPRVGERFGLLPTMVFTHVPSNLMLAAIPLAPSFGVAAALLLGRYSLGQMDVPTRQAYVMALVDPTERTAAAAYTNSARYVARPLGPLLAGAAQATMPGLPFLVAGGLKTLYDLALWTWFRRVPLPT